MAKGRKNTKTILIDLHYQYSTNKFEEFYGEGISYSEIEQVSYIDFKEMVFDIIGKNVKFRKFGRENRVLTIKVDMTHNEHELFLKIFNNEAIDKEATADEIKNPDGETKYLKFNFLHDFEVSNVRDLTKEERIKFKKTTEQDEIEEEEAAAEAELEANSEDE